MRHNRLVLVAFLFLGLINFPLISLVDSSKTIGGVPVIYAYIFIVWLVVIVFTGIILNDKNKK
jgi:predicted tellurium resistance membrane protein TerC